MARHEHEFARNAPGAKIMHRARAVLQVVLQDRCFADQPDIDVFACGHAQRVGITVRLARQPFIEPKKFLRRVVDHHAGHGPRDGIDRPAFELDVLGVRATVIAITVAVVRADIDHNAPIGQIVGIGGVIDVTTFRDKVDAILLAWEPGEEGGNAIADVLSGKVNPSGKLATTFPAAYSDVPSAKNFPGKEFPGKATVSVMGRSVPAEVTYQEGIYVGYRYYNTFKVKTAYEFGYGISYTNFTYSNLSLSSGTFDGKLTATVTITNKGSVAGKEVAELYLSAPRKTLDKPAEELKGFAKTGLLQPGGSETLTFVLDGKSLASFYTDQSAWIADSGEYTVKIGASSEDIKLSKTFNLPKQILVEKVHKALAPTVAIDELKSK